MTWKHIDTGKRSAAENMELDAALLADLKHERDPILHFYDWEKEAATYGHFIDPTHFLNMEGVKRHGLDLAKRPTGGGIIFHNCDLAFSVLVPATSPFFSSDPLKNYAFVNNRVLGIIEQLMKLPAQLLPEESSPLDQHCRSFCMAKPTKYDVMIGNKKVGGAAQRKTCHGFLHQGSIAIGLLSEPYLTQVVAGGSQVIEGMRQNSFALLGTSWTVEALEETRNTLRQLLKRAFSEE